MAGPVVTNAETKRAYGRGYAAGGRRTWEHLRRLLGVLRGYRARLDDGFTARRCDTCRRWERGGPTTAWGTCALEFEWVDEPMAWEDQDRRATRRKSRLITHDAFGCTNWLPAPPTNTKTSGGV